MDLKIKKGHNGWGFVETFRKYNWLNTTYVEVVSGVTERGTFTLPYVYRGEEFIPLSVIQEEMGIQKYIKAKKPFYSLITDGFVVKMRAYYNEQTGEYYTENSTFEIYSINALRGFSDNEAHFTRILEVPEEVRKLMSELLEELGSCCGDREKFLSRRIEENGRL